MDEKTPTTTDVQTTQAAQGAEGTQAAPAAVPKRSVLGRIVVWTARLLWCAIALVVAAVCLAGILLYVPSVQERVVEKVCASLSEQTGYDVHLKNLRLSFPLHLSADSIVACEGGDTLLQAERMRLHLRVLPLLRAEADVAEVELGGVSLDTRELVGGTHVRGKVGRIAAPLPSSKRLSAARIGWETQHVRVAAAEIRDADLSVWLSDTAFTDTTTSKPWLVSVGGLRLRNVKARVALATAPPSIKAGADSIVAGRGQMWIAVDIPRGKVQNGHFDTRRGTYAVQGVDIAGANIAYTSRGSDGKWQRRSTPATLPDDCKRTSADSLRAEWDYEDNISGLEAWSPFTQRPSGALDTDEIILTNTDLRVAPLRYSDAEGTTLNIEHAALHELNSGMSIDELRGEVKVDDEGIALPDFTLQTPFSKLRIGGKIPWSALSEGFGSLNMDLDLTLGPQDVEKILRSRTLDLSRSQQKHILDLYPRRPLSLKGHVRGNLEHIQLLPLDIAMPDVVKGRLSGRIDHVQTNPAADLNFNLQTGSMLPQIYRKAMPDVAQTVSLPGAMSMKGSVRYGAPGGRSVKSDAVSLACNLGVGGGNADIKANVSSLSALSTTSGSESWNVAATTHNLPIRSFLPTMDIAPLSAHITARGNTFDLLSPRARITAKADIHRGAFSGINISGIHADADVSKGDVAVSVISNTAALDGTATLTARIEDLLRDKNTTDADYISGDIRLDLATADLRALGFTADTLETGGMLTAHFHSNGDFTAYGAEGTIENIFLQTNEQGFSSENTTFSFATSPDTTYANASSGDLELHIGAEGSVEKILPRMTALADEAVRQIDAKSLDMPALQREFLPMKVYVKARKENPLSGYLALKGIEFNTAYIDLISHPETGLTGEAKIGALSKGGLLLDTIGLSMEQDSLGLALNGFVRNYKKKNPTKFDASLEGHIFANEAEIRTKFYDNQKEKSIDLGVRAALADGGVSVSLFPQNPILAYRTFTLNKDNFIFLGEGGQIRADVDLVADDGTGLRILSEPTDSVNDITASVYNINLAELSNVVPYLPKLGGTLNGDFHILDNHETLSAMGSLDMQNFAYEGTQLGNVGADVVYLPQGEDEHFASAYIRAADEEVLEASGTYYGKTETFDGTASLQQFPLALLNAFLEGTDVALDGHAIGDLAIQGALSSPKINGELRMDSAHIYSPAYGFRFLMDEKPIAVENSRIRFDKFKLATTGKNPLTLNGNIDASDLASVRLALTLQGKNFELIDTKRTRQSTIFGTVMADMVGSVTGTLSNMTVRGKLDILDKTDMTYILKDSPLTVDNRLDDLVQFVSFNDSIEDGEEPQTEEEMSLNMVLGINVHEGARFRCFLSEDGKSYANIVGGGNMTFRLTPQGEMRLTGKLTAQSGDMKYEMPVIPLRTFNLVEGSTIDFTGDPTNPTLNIRATERMKVLIAGDDDRQRAVAFDVGVAITKPLDRMGLEFTIDAPDDLTVQNQLASMSAEQRSKAAVAMMATGMYLTDTGNMSSGFKANNALNAFLQNEIQNITAGALKTVDLNVGVESGTSLVGTQTTDYSFQFSKRFWGDRIRVVIGGRVSAGENADNRAESIINNVSIEYKLNKGATQHVRIFYDRDSQDPFEGQLTETGVGWNVRNKADNLGDLLLFWRKKETPSPMPRFREMRPEAPREEKTDSIQQRQN